MPYAVEAADDGGLRSHEGIAHPYCKDGVFLAEGLSGGHAFVVMTGTMAVPAAYPVAEGELYGAAYE